jgi:hypothetical protein
MQAPLGRRFAESAQGGQHIPTVSASQILKTEKRDLWRRVSASVNAALQKAWKALSSGWRTFLSAKEGL